MTPESLPGSAGEHVLQERLEDRCQAATRARQFYNDQVLDYLNERMQAFLGETEAMFLATADATGLPDCSPRFGPAGFIRALSPWLVAWPEYRGNGVMASAGNLLENPKAAIVAMDFTKTRMGLHVAGNAEVITDAAARQVYPTLLSAPEIPGRRAELWVILHVTEAYVQCKKHVPQYKVAPIERAWGSDRPDLKGGDFFGVAAQRRAEGR